MRIITLVLTPSARQALRELIGRHHTGGNSLIEKFYRFNRIKCEFDFHHQWSTARERIWLDQKFTAVLVTHDVAEAVALADRVVVIGDRRITLDINVPVARPR